MALATQEKQIGANLYQVTQLDAIRGRGVFTRFVKLIAPVFGELAEKGAEKTGMAKALAALASNITAEDMNFFCDSFAPTTCLVTTGDDGKTRRPNLKEHFGLHFASNYAEMLQWLYFCLEVNFGSFFAEAGLRRATSETPVASS